MRFITNVKNSNTEAIEKLKKDIGEENIVLLKLAYTMDGKPLPGFIAVYDASKDAFEGDCFGIKDYIKDKNILKKTLPSIIDKENNFFDK